MKDIVFYKKTGVRPRASVLSDRDARLDFRFPSVLVRISPVGRTGRIIGRSWDMMAALVEGPMSEADIDWTRQELPKRYGGRATPQTLIWCRSNRSSRGFNHAVERLAQGLQPDPTLSDRFAT